ncbi:MAG: rhodanese-like domain-containing protein [Pseudoxanthomonas suwonensis]|nr:rhodanese-like domain-containing protein [Pseudoxanthomonas suwonensis]
MSKTAADLVAEARRNIREISAAEWSEGRRGGVLIDVREPVEYATGHLGGAVNIPRGVLEFQVDAHPAVAKVVDPALSHKHQPVTVICRTGGRAALAAVALQQLGFADVRSIAGGTTAWIDAGLPLVND